MPPDTLGSPAVALHGREAWLNRAIRLRNESAAYVGLLEASVAMIGAATVVYTVFVPHQRRRCAAEGVGRVLTHILADYGGRVVVAEVDTRNAASIALLERLRFVRVGPTVGADEFKGASSDEHRYELRRPGAAVRSAVASSLDDA